MGKYTIVGYEPLP